MLRIASISERAEQTAIRSESARRWQLYLFARLFPVAAGLRARMQRDSQALADLRLLDRGGERESYDEVKAVIEQKLVSSRTASDGTSARATKIRSTAAVGASLAGALAAPKACWRPD